MHICGRKDIALEMQESLKASYFVGPRTTFLITKHIVPIPLQKPFTEEQISKLLKKISRKIKVVPATQICQEKLGTNVVAGIYLISLASFKSFMPLKPASILGAIKQVIPQQYLELNKKTFELAKKHA